MKTIASLLIRPADQATEEIWNWLEENCDLANIRLTPLPHFSWQSAEDYDTEKLHPVLESLASRYKPFKLSTSGLGIFSGESPVIYLAPIMTKKLMEMNKTIWRATHDYAISLNSFYLPDQWAPHISLTYKDTNADNLLCALRDLIFRPIKLEIMVDHIAFLYRYESDSGIISKYKFSG